MADHDPRIDAYIADAPPFAQPILERLRTLVHSTCPDIEESIKWSKPFFSYQGSPLCMMAAFRQHCGFGFWLSKQVIGETAEDGMGQFGKLHCVVDLRPEKRFADFVRRAMALNDAGVKPKRTRPVGKPAPHVPDALAAEFAKQKHAAARATYEAFSPGKQREYVDWIDEAKTDATRHKRITAALEWLAEGKQRHWKYAK
jgi:uncharacterized protein YdeI (YjbR/CyaY-like superfamily)